MAKEELTRNSSLTIGTTQIEVSPECYQQRSCIIITNTSPAAQVINIAIGEEATAGEGIQLSVGGVYQDSRDGQYMPSNKQINAVSSAAGGTIAVHERTLTDNWRL
jgi:hypothetical protein